MHIAYKEKTENNVSFLSHFFQVTKKMPKPMLAIVCQESLGKGTASDTSSHEHQTSTEPLAQRRNKQKAMRTSTSGALVTQWSWPNNPVAPGICHEGQETYWTSYFVVAGPRGTNILPGHFIKGCGYVSTHDCPLGHPMSSWKADETSSSEVHISSIP